MTLQEAMKSGKKFYSCVNPDSMSQWFTAGTGSHKDLVDCDYFIHYECGLYDPDPYFCTSIDLYSDEVFGEWEVVDENDGGFDEF